MVKAACQWNRYMQLHGPSSAPPPTSTLRAYQEGEEPGCFYWLCIYQSSHPSFFSSLLLESPSFPFFILFLVLGAASRCVTINHRSFLSFKSPPSLLASLPVTSDIAPCEALNTSYTRFLRILESVCSRLTAYYSIRLLLLDT